MLRVIGDVHQKYDKYIPIAKEAEYSVQLGDMGFAYHQLDVLDANKHKFFGGNHDNYDIIHKSPHSLGNYGLSNFGETEFFFVRGAWSPDWRQRTPHVDWWEQEELFVSEHTAVKDNYLSTKPQVVITHDCPLFISRMLKLESIGSPSVGLTSNRTNVLLEQLFDINMPKLWIFGHWHTNWEKRIGHCRFLCLKELAYIDIE